MAKKNRREIDRREFQKVLVVGNATTTAALYGCSLKDGSVTVAGGSGNTPAGEMTYRINPSTGDKVSILGYGCMRWPTVVKGGQDEIDEYQCEDKGKHQARRTFSIFF